MTDEELKAIREKAEAATGEPMCRNLYDLGGGRMFVDDAGVRALILDAYDAPNRDFYFSARADVLALLDEIDRLRKENANLEEANNRMWRIHEWQDAAGIIKGSKR